MRPAVGLLFAVGLVALVFASVTSGSADRAGDARKRTLEKLKTAMAEHGLAMPPQELLLRAFKQERVLEVWAGNGKEMRLVRAYPFTASSGTLGPKRKEGDKQIPEGFYRVEALNPQSRFHLSLRLDYPNASDRILSDRDQPGSDIMIHGKAVTIGCIPIGDEAIEELYTLVAEFRAKRTQPVQVHILPSRLDEAGLAALESRFARSPGLLEFWRGLAEGYRRFEATRRPPRIEVEADGSYDVKG